MFPTSFAIENKFEVERNLPSNKSKSVSIVRHEATSKVERNFPPVLPSVGSKNRSIAWCGPTQSSIQRSELPSRAHLLGCMSSSQAPGRHKKMVDWLLASLVWFLKQRWV
jgi:hypothetical protein